MQPPSVCEEIFDFAYENNVYFCKGPYVTCSTGGLFVQASAVWEVRGGQAKHFSFSPSWVGTGQVVMVRQGGRGAPGSSTDVNLFE